ncbi:hypothetical protein GYMLUDRAFT_88531 [Collybiopsis luxurians FD-317 M1]|uniref:F-box domain-containing protein n=1 Tax=Collybiopsis luxurians FD-317 M1 TaxID=944289 RepID=A0A0D0BEF5_9AGAR|nr:hypothetical protein GYMLUDRAFT_88531 [Collybiopsis luxurians FD-317 M1]
MLSDHTRNQNSLHHPPIHHPPMPMSMIVPLFLPSSSSPSLSSPPGMPAHTIASAIQKLPTEILVSIFRLLIEAIESQVEDEDNWKWEPFSVVKTRTRSRTTLTKRVDKPSPDPSLSPLLQKALLTRISRAWHDIVLGTPCLWARLTVPWWCPANVLNELLFRSGGIMVELRMFGCEELGIPTTNTRKIYRVLSKHAHRFQTIRMDVTHEIMLDLSSGGMKFPVLEELRLRCTGDAKGPLLMRGEAVEIIGGGESSGLGVENCTLDAFNEAPRLVRAVLVDRKSVYHGKSYSSCVRLPWDQLRSLECIGRCLPRMQLLIGDENLDESIDFPRSYFTLPELSEYSFMPNSPDVLPSLESISDFSSLALPSLQSLILGQNAYIEAYYLIQRSVSVGARIREIRAKHAWIFRSCLLPILELVNNDLEDLYVTIDAHTKGGPLWSYISSLPLRLPRLRRLVVTMNDHTSMLPESFDEVAFLEMVKARNGSSAKMKKGEEVASLKVEMRKMPYFPLTVKSIEVDILAASPESSFEYR